MTIMAVMTVIIKGVRITDLRRSGSITSVQKWLCAYNLHTHKVDIHMYAALHCCIIRMNMHIISIQCHMHACTATCTHTLFMVLRTHHLLVFWVTKHVEIPQVPNSKSTPVLFRCRVYTILVTSNNSDRDWLANGNLGSHNTSQYIDHSVGEGKP